MADKDAPAAAARNAWHDPLLTLAVGFTGNPLDRCSERRDDLTFVAGLRRDPRARILLFAADVPLLLVRQANADAVPEGSSEAVTPELGATLDITVPGGADSVGMPYSLHETMVRILAGAGFGSGAQTHAAADEESVLLGIDADGAPWFAQRADAAIEAGASSPSTLPSFPTTLLTWPAVTTPHGDAHAVMAVEAVGLRVLAAQGRVCAAELAMLAQAKAVLDWHVRHRFCARCGAPSRVAAAGWRRECPACAAVHFPRVDPVVIMIVVDPDGPNGPRCLLGRQPQFAPGMYSALAGFLEPGETVEEAVRREVREEAGIASGAVRYLASQPWPFPGSLMIGCAALATSTDLQIDHNELEDARWFDRDEVASMLAGTHAQQLKTPQPHAIAATLIRAFVDGLLDR